MKKSLLLALALSKSLFALNIIDNPSSDIININVSNSSVNRIVLPAQILDVVYSKEKGIDIKISDNQAFIKFLPIQKEKVRVTGKNQVEPIGEPEIVYDKAGNSEVFFVTASKTYSFSLNPKDMEAETIIINDFSASKEEILKYESDDSYMKTMAKITESILKGGTPQGYKTKKIDKVLSKNSTLITKELMNYDGVLYRATLLEVENKTDKAIVLDSKDYIRIAKESPKAISIYYNNEVNHLLPYSKAQIVIITKGGRNQK
ncbi:TraK domain-containing protein [Campylobacter helveticus]|uniref:TraK domain-containing protein n=1 Tax=Campylobacter helveticus TaxID=28898 RepID=UPI0022EB3D21|nr:type-F conjugative transfer system secretin TraK [Campylobacter helveticus]